MAYHRYHGVKTHIVRIFNTYGPRMRLNDGRVLPNFMRQALRGEPLTIFGRGEQTRSFCYVTDLVEGIVRLLNIDFAEPVNLGNPAEITVMQLAEEILSLVEGTKVRSCRGPASGRSEAAKAGYQSRSVFTELATGDRAFRGLETFARIFSYGSLMNIGLIPTGNHDCGPGAGGFLSRSSLSGAHPFIRRKGFPLPRYVR